MRKPKKTLTVALTASLVAVSVTLLMHHAEPETVEALSDLIVRIVRAVLPD